MPVKAGQIVINLTLGQAQFFQDIVGAKARIKDFTDSSSTAVRRLGSDFRETGQHAVSSMQATSGALRDLEGHFGSNIRASERFLATTLGLGPALQAAFPLVGGLAFGGMLVDLGEKSYKFFQDIATAPQRIADAFRNLDAPIVTANDELRLANDRLGNHIAMLSGHAQNTLAITLDEARVAADRLSESLNKDLDGMAKLMKEHSLGSFTAFFTDQASTSGDADHDEKTRKDIVAINEEGQASVRAAKTKEEARAAEVEWHKKLLAALDAEIEKQKQLVQVASELQSVHEGKNPTAPMLGQSFDFDYQSTPAIAPDREQHPISAPDQSLILKERQGRLKTLADFRDKSALIFSNIDLTGTDNGLKAAQDRPYEDRMKALAAQLADVRAKSLAIGQPQWAQELLKAGGEAVKTVAALNKELERAGKPALTGAQAGKLTSSLLDIDKAEDQDAWKAKFTASTAAIQERIQVTNLLTAAVGKGIDAAREANVQSRIVEQVGVQKLNDPKWMAANAPQVAQLKEGFGNEFDVNQGKTSRESLDRLNQQIDLERALAAVQMQGAEAVRQAALNVKIAHMEKMGATKEEIQAERELYDFERSKDSNADVAKLTAQIDMERALAAVQVQGSEAVRQAELAERVEQMRKAGATEEEIAAEKTLYKERQANANAADLAKINERIAATQRLASAVLGGAEAERQAALENKYSEMQRNGASPEVIAGTRQADQLDHQREITSEALKAATAYGDQYQKLSQEIEVLEKIKAAQDETIKGAQNEAAADDKIKGLKTQTLAVEIALRDLENQRLKLLTEETLKLGTAKAGVDAFFLEMQQQGKQASDVLFESLNSALDRTSENLAKLLTGQKTSWGAAFKEIGTQMVQSSIKGLLQEGIGAIGKKVAPPGGIAAKLGLGPKRDGDTEATALWVQIAQGVKGVHPGSPDSGLGGGGGKPDGSSPSMAFWVQMVQAGSGQPQNSSSLSALGLNLLKNSGPGILQGLFGGGSGGGASAESGGEGIPSVTSSIDFGGAMANGGGVEPGVAYKVNENEDEYFIPSRAGSIVPHPGSGGGSSGDVHYHIDARGADLGVLNRIQQGMAEVHRSAVKTAVLAMHERQKRTVGR